MVRAAAVIVRASLIVAAAVIPATAAAQVVHAGISTTDLERGIAIARVLVSAMHHATPGHVSTGRVSTGGVSASATRTARRVLDSGEDFIGTPYVWGGSTPKGFDCSGFVQYVFREHGIELPRTSRQMANAGVRVPARVASLAPGDLMLFDGATSTISHVAIYAGDGRILHSSSSGHGVGYDVLDDSKRGRYFTSHLVAARRVIANGESLVQPLARLEQLVPFDHFDPPDRAPTH